MSQPWITPASLILGRNGSRDAADQLVARYQSPVCALAYSACGNISQSQDLAQGDLLLSPGANLPIYGSPPNSNHGSLVSHAISSTIPRAAKLAVHSQVRGRWMKIWPHLLLPILSAIGHQQGKRRKFSGARSRKSPTLIVNHSSSFIVNARIHRTRCRSDGIVRRRPQAAPIRGRKLLPETNHRLCRRRVETKWSRAETTLGVLAALPAMTISALCRDTSGARQRRCNGSKAQA